MHTPVRKYAVAAVAVAAMLGARDGVGQCCGDCNGDYEVTIDEIIGAVTRTLEGCSNDAICSAASCPAQLAQCRDELAACESHETRVVKIGGDGQSGAPGTVSGERLIVRVLSAREAPVENVSVFFSTSSPHSVTDQVTVTDANGAAFTSVRSGDRAGSFTVGASVPGASGSPIVFTLSTTRDASAVESREIGHVDIPLSLVNVGDVFGTYLHEIELLGEWAFIPTGTFGNGIAVIDLHNPAAPRVAAGVSGLRSRDVAVEGGWLYSVSGNDFNSVDISDPLAPAMVATLALNPGSGAAATTVAVSGSVAFVTGGGPALGDFGALRGIDVNDPTHPTIGARSTQSGGADVVLNGKYAFVAAYNNGLYVFDISNPLASLPMVASMGTTGSATRVRWADGGIIYVLNTSSTSSSIAVIDVKVPTSPRLLTVTAIPTQWQSSGDYFNGQFFGMALDDNYLYLYVGGNRGVIVIDVSDPNAPDPVGRVDPDSFVGGIAVLNGQLAVAHLRGLSVIEIG